MKAVLQRVSEATVEVDGTAVGSIATGLVVLFCVEPGDQPADADYFARKIAHMRLFPDRRGRMNRSLIDDRGAVLAISQFTLAADWRKGNRPGFSGAAPGPLGERLYDHFCEQLRGHGVGVETGVFGAEMALHLVNCGPVTIVMERP